MATPAPSDAPRSPWWASLLLLLIPTLFFALLEGGLRLGGYGDDYPLFLEVPGQPDYLFQNRDVGRRYFAQTSTIPNSQNDFFRKEKDADTFRILVQGGSSAAGYPFYRGGSFSRMLEQRLLQTFPGRNVEVINTAMAAVNSYTLLDLSQEILEQQPDAVLIYAGHNEYYGTLGVGSAESLGGFRGLVNLYLRVQSWRTVQLLRAGLAGVAGLFAEREAGQAPSATLMERMVGEQSIPYGSPLYDLGLRQFEGNLRDLLATYEAAGVPVFIGTVASNERDHVPFISGLAPDTDAEAWNAGFAAAQRQATQGDTTAALARLETLLATDSLHAEAFYLQAQLLEGRGEVAQAQAAYLAAKDRDQLRFRAPEALNATLREVAAEHGATVVETRAALAAVSPGGLIGANVMLEHLHPNLDGYFRIADAFYQALREAQLIGTWEQAVATAEARQELLVTPLDSLLGHYRVQQLMGSWPFQPPGVVRRVPLEPSTPVEEIAVAVYRSEASWPDGIAALRAYYEDVGDTQQALRMALAMIQEFPFAVDPYLVAGNLLVKQGRYTESLTYFEAADDRGPSAPAQRMIGSILLQIGRRDDAIGWLERAQALDPTDPAVLYNLGGAYALAGRYDEARTMVTRLLEQHPDHQDGRRLLASLP
ncbi:MAG: tetratricopeptide repeat protein [Bacteroidota bacterium]